MAEAAEQTGVPDKAGEAMPAAAGTRLGSFGPVSLLGRPLATQLGLMAAVAAVVALAVVIFLWSQQPTYRLLYGNLEARQAAAVVEALQAQGIPYRLEEASGAVMVPAERVYETRLRLAAQGLPKPSGVGLELLQKDLPLGTSQFMESARYNYALQNELARTVAAIDGVASAKVHLALPKRSVFIRERVKPSASVLVNLEPGRSLSREQVAAITNLVASSIPYLEQDAVTVVDQRGRLLTQKEDSSGLGLSARQFAYQRELEQSYVKRIESLLAPIVGEGRVRAEVSAELDFTVSESTEERYDPTASAVRSEQFTEQQRLEDPNAIGVPGALSNQPPGAGTTDPLKVQTDNRGRPIDLSRGQTRNYEVGKTIRHVRKPVGVVRRLSVGVVIDNTEIKDEKGEAVRPALTDAEIAQLTALVKQAVGFRADRGDEVNVIATEFRAQAEPVAPSSPSTSSTSPASSFVSPRGTSARSPCSRSTATTSAPLGRSSSLSRLPTASESGATSTSCSCRPPRTTSEKSSRSKP